MCWAIPTRLKRAGMPQDIRSCCCCDKVSPSIILADWNCVSCCRRTCWMVPKPGVSKQDCSEWGNDHWLTVCMVNCVTRRSEAWLSLRVLSGLWISGCVLPVSSSIDDDGVGCKTWNVMNPARRYVLPALKWKCLYGIALHNGVGWSSNKINYHCIGQAVYTVLAHRENKPGIVRRMGPRQVASLYGT